MRLEEDTIDRMAQLLADVGYPDDEEPPLWLSELTQQILNAGWIKDE